jgi:hypothetical protein
MNKDGYPTWLRKPAGKLTFVLPTPKKEVIMEEAL